MKDKVVLTGFMGVGKTTTLEELRSQDFNAIDLDQYIEEKTKTSVKKYIQNFGIEQFRNLELDCLEEIDDQYDHYILALGGGTLLNDEALDFIKRRCTSIYLKKKIENLEKSLKNDESRPLLEMQTIKQLYYERLPQYLQSDYVINCDDLSPKSTANIVSQLIH